MAMMQELWQEWFNIKLQLQIKIPIAQYYIQMYKSTTKCNSSHHAPKIQARKTLGYPVSG
jgi:hypothetical protein